MEPVVGTWLPLRAANSPKIAGQSRTKFTAFKHSAIATSFPWIGMLPAFSLPKRQSSKPNCALHPTRARKPFRLFLIFVVGAGG